LTLQGVNDKGADDDVVDVDDVVASFPQDFSFSPLDGVVVLKL
jgi:hypothetical protein